MSCGIRRIVNGFAAHQVVARRDVSEPRTHPPSPKSPSKGSARSRVHARAKMWISVLGWTWPDGSKGRAVNGLSGVAPMVYFHFFTAAPSSQLSWLGATSLITGIFVLFRFRPRPYIARASHDTKAQHFVQADASRLNSGVVRLHITLQSHFEQPVVQLAL